MPIFEITPDSIRPVSQTTFSAAGLNERTDLQRVLRANIEIISPDTLVISEEFCDWDDSRRRIDLLGLDKQANLVVIELKRSEDGGHMELQAIRYSAMVSTLTFEKATEVYQLHLNRIGSNLDARASILEFLDWDAPDEDQFAQDVRIVLVSAEFSKELTTAVLWLNDHDVDIRCIKMRPYADFGRILVDVQQVIPLPEAADYQVRVREKNRQERVSRESDRDFTKYEVTIHGRTESDLPKRVAILKLIRAVCSEGVKPEDIIPHLPWRGENRLFFSVEGTLDQEQFLNAAITKQALANKTFDSKRWHCRTDDLIHSGGKTYAVSNQWGRTGTARTVEAVLTAFPNCGVSVRALG